MKRKRVIISAVLMLLLVGFGGAYVLLPKNKINAASWKQIQLGMTHSQVEDVLGGPGLNEADASKTVFKMRIIGFGDVLESTNSFGKTQLYWISQNGVMEVYFGDSGLVTGKQFTEWKCVDSNFLDRVRDWFGW